ncbi:uncharacterized membrane protein YkvA (DUF1232 family) [Hydrogenispora ethanolica]|uniref:Uncharacterized membrane protein YkvA (DUF1232 family) n=1 Tax=Hydrogenispora ethanolica TaxID=1082276 RepID=A0A4R1S756_HYDET|nr:uncharacterized membrane protein YkvA (DUF1232 family) [Hydrogenispora ethanolica]
MKSSCQSNRLERDFITWLLRRQTYALWLAYKDPRVPWYAKWLAVLVLGYAFSPIDLIPDFIPVLGYLDDLLLVPLGIKLLIHWIPREVLAEYQERAESEARAHPKNWRAAAIIVILWVLALLWLGMKLVKGFQK